MVLRLTAPSQTQSDQPPNNTALQTPIRVKQVITQCKETYLEHRKEETKSQSRLERCLALKRDNELAEYLYCQRWKTEAVYIYIGQQSTNLAVFFAARSANLDRLQYTGVFFGPPI